MLRRCAQQPWNGLATRTRAGAARSLQSMGAHEVSSTCVGTTPGHSTSDECFPPADNPPTVSTNRSPTMMSSSSSSSSSSSNKKTLMAGDARKAVAGGAASWSSTVHHFSANKDDAVAYASDDDDAPLYSSLRHTGYLLLHGRRMWLPVLFGLGYVSSPILSLLTSLVGSYASLLYLSMAVLLQRRAISGGQNTLGKDMCGYTCVVTGGTRGIGLYTAMQLLNMGAHVILLGKSGSELYAMDFLQAHCSRIAAVPNGAESSRAVSSVPSRPATWAENCAIGRRGSACSDSSSSKGQSAHCEASIEGALPLQQRVTFLPVNLGDQVEVMATSARIKALTNNRIDLLVNAAAVWTEEPSITRDGVEEHIAVNFLGPFHLTEALLPALRRAVHQHGRVVYVTCAAHNGVRTRKVVQERMMLKPDGRVGQQITARCYSASKLGNIYHAQSIASRRSEGIASSTSLLRPHQQQSQQQHLSRQQSVREAGGSNGKDGRHPVDVCCVDPGFCATELQSGNAGETAEKGMVARALHSLWCKTAYEGSQSVVHCCVCDAKVVLQQGSYYAECRHMPSGLSKRAHDQHARESVMQWARSKTIDKYYTGR